MPLWGFLFTSLAAVRHGHHVENVLRQLGDRAEDGANSTTHFYDDATLDHFGGVSGGAKRWSQRYYVDERYWCGSGCPVFLYIGGEGPQGPPSDRLFMATLARKMGALMLALEHRYYGESSALARLQPAPLHPRIPARGMGARAALPRARPCAHPRSQSPWPT